MPACLEFFFAAWVPLGINEIFHLGLWQGCGSSQIFNASASSSWHGMEWNGMEDDFSIFNTGNFGSFHFHSIPKVFHSIFHSILEFSSKFHSILPYQRKCRREAMQRLFCCFASLQCCKQPLVKVRQQY